MTPDEPPTPATPAAPDGGHGETARRRVVAAAADLLHGPPRRDGSAGGATVTAHASDRSGAMTVYLALLQDRLPVYARIMNGLTTRAGTAEVRHNLATAARATIDFYGQVLAAKLSVVADPDQLLRLRRVLAARELGPHAAHEALADYLAAERRLGRVPGDTDCAAAARLLVGACLHYAFTKMLLGEVPAADAYIADMVRGLRLDP